MAAPFGFSVGDFIAVGKLLHDIVQVINDRDGVACDYRSFISTLRSLYVCINTIKDALEHLTHDSSNPGLHEVSLINGLIYEIKQCRGLLNFFLDNTRKYTASLLPHDKAQKLKEARAVMSFFSNKIETAQRKLSWLVFRKEDVQRLERDLHGHLLALQLYESLLQHMTLFRIERRTTEVAIGTHKGEATTIAIYDLLKSIYNQLPQQMSDRLNKHQPVFFEDALGRLIELPREFCISKERFERHIDILFEGMPGYDQVVRRQYHLEDPEGTTTISALNWHVKVTAGARVAMTLLFYRITHEAKRRPRQICPRCKTSASVSDSQRGMTECFNCKLLFELVDATDVRDDTYGDIWDRPQDRNRLDSEEQKKKETTELDAFRRIRYITAFTITGRRNLLREMLKKIEQSKEQPSGRLLLRGLGGIGKAQIAELFRT